MASSARRPASRGPNRRTSASDTDPRPGCLDCEAPVQPITVTCAGRRGGPGENAEPWVMSHTAMAAALWHRVASGAASSKSPST